MYTQRAVKKYRHHSLDDNILISNDDLGYPRLTQFSTGAQVEYVYTPSGQKVREIHRSPRGLVTGGAPANPQDMMSDTTDYIGPAVYRNGKPDMVRYTGGYASLSRSGTKYVPAFHHYITDYLGNNRAVVRASDGAFVQITHYYPWGSVYGDMGTGVALQPYKYGDKELDLTAGVARYDYAARAYFTAIPRFDRPDALAGKYPHISPYSFCANNPVNIVDPTGMDYKVVKDEKNKTFTVIAKYITDKESYDSAVESAKLWNSQKGIYKDNKTKEEYAIQFSLTVEEIDPADTPYKNNTERAIRHSIQIKDPEEREYSNGYYVTDNIEDPSKNGTTLAGKLIFVRPSKANGDTGPHEIGHTLGLIHTWRGLMTAGGNDINRNQSISNKEMMEIIKNAISGKPSIENGNRAGKGYIEIIM